MFRGRTFSPTIAMRSLWGRPAPTANVAAMMLNSLVMALAIAIGKIAISLPSAYAVVFFRFPLGR